MTEDAPTSPAAPAAPEEEDPGLTKSTGFRAAIIVLILVVIGGGVASIDMAPNLSHLEVTLLSGSEQGHYYHLVEEMKTYAGKRKGKVKNDSTKGSLENLDRLLKGAADDETRYALVQDGLDLPADSTLQLIARLTSPETVFFLAKDGDALTSFSQLKGKVGIGPEGSGTALVARQIFASQGFDTLEVELITTPSITEQVDLLAAGKLDVAVFVIHANSKLIRRAVRELGLQIAGFWQVEAVANAVPSLHAGRIPAGQFDPVRELPPTDKPVLQVDTLVLGDGSASRSETISLLTLLLELYPGFLEHNRTTANTTGVPTAPVSRQFFENGGPEVLDEYAPWLVDLVPLSNLVHIAMALSVLFNLMGMGNRFHLWRIDVRRIELEVEIFALFGGETTTGELRRLEPQEPHREAPWGTRFAALIAELEALTVRARKQSVGMLVPMGGEMSYRYQETLTNQWIGALRIYRGRLATDTPAQ